MRKVLSMVACGAVLLLGSAVSDAATFTFTQSGFDGGGSVSGSFAGTDLDSNGQLSSINGEITAYSMSFSGDSIVGDFSHGFGDLIGLVYDLGSGFLGDGTGGDVEGVWSSDAFFSYLTGQALTLTDGGYAAVNATQAWSETIERIVVTEVDGQVPEPGTLALLGLGVAGLAALRRRKR